MDETTTLPAQQDAPAPAAQKQSRTPNILLPILDYAEVLVFCLLMILLIYGCGIRICSVSGDSMLPTLQNQQRLLVSDIGYEPQQGDIIVFHQINTLDPSYNEPIIKRIIATEGQHVIIDFETGIISVDGIVLEEDYIQLVGDEYRVLAEHHMVNRIFDAIVPPNTVFVMGDNRNKSLDSRSNVIGFVDERRILGRVITRLTPVALFGEVE